MKFLKTIATVNGYNYKLQHLDSCTFNPSFCKEDENDGHWKFDFELGNKIIDYTIHTGNIFSFETRCIRDVDINIVRLLERDCFKDFYNIEGDDFVDIHIEVVHKTVDCKTSHKIQVTINHWKILSKEEV